MELHGVKATFGNFHLDVDVTLPGGVTGLFGMSGAGKTTLMEIIAGVKRPQNGRLSFDGRVLFDCDKRLFVPSQQRRIGYVPQDLALFPHMNVEANIRYGEKQHEGASRSSFQKICEVLEIENKLPQYPGSLSGGEGQRVAIARALMTQPSTLLLDEPLRGLHHNLRATILSFLVQIREQFALPMLYVTHSPSEVMMLCQQVLILDKGKMVSYGKPSDHFIETTELTYNLKSAQDADRYDEPHSPHL
jgi:molybdate transport system ATP-binding protein